MPNLFLVQSSLPLSLTLIAFELSPQKSKSKDSEKETKSKPSLSPSFSLSFSLPLSYLLRGIKEQSWREIKKQSSNQTKLFPLPPSPSPSPPLHFFLSIYIHMLPKSIFKIRIIFLEMKIKKTTKKKCNYFLIISI